jgi:hypothetical protein
LRQQKQEGDLRNSDQCTKVYVDKKFRAQPSSRFPWSGESEALGLDVDLDLDLQSSTDPWEPSTINCDVSLFLLAIKEGFLKYEFYIVLWDYGKMVPGTGEKRWTADGIPIYQRIGLCNADWITRRVRSGRRVRWSKLASRFKQRWRVGYHRNEDESNTVSSRSVSDEDENEVETEDGAETEDEFEDGNEVELEDENDDEWDDEYFEKIDNPYIDWTKAETVVVAIE